MASDLVVKDHDTEPRGASSTPRWTSYRRNFWCLTLDFGFFGLGMAFLGPTTVLPGFLTALGASSAVIGFISTLQRAGWLLPQLLAARYLADKPYKKPYIIVPAGISRAMILLLAVLVLATGARNAGVTITIAIVALAVFWISDGLGSMAWFDFLSKSIPANRRGRLTSLGQILSGVLSFVAGFAVEWVLGDRGPGFPVNYASLFLAAFGMLGLSLTAITLGVESRSPTVQKVPTWREYLPQLGRILRHDRAFGRYLLTRQIFGLAGLAAPFYITYALDELQLPDRVVGRFTSVGVIGVVIAAALFGWLNERYGTRLASLVSIPVTAAIPVLALLIPRWISDPVWLAWGYSLVFLVSQASNSCYLPAWTSYVLEWASDTERPLYVGLTNTLNGITALFATLGGLILQWTDGNYALLFIITAIGTLIALPLSVSLPEPRKVKRESVLA